MHRMRRLAVLSALVLASLNAAGREASADLLRNPAGRAYPDISANVNGVLNYTYNASNQTGVFTLNNTPYLIAGSSNAEFSFDPTDTSKHQTLSITVDKDGKVLGGSYELYGTVTAGGQTFSGLLLEGKPTDLGSLDLGSAASGSDMFDVNVTLDDKGALSKYFGPDAYIEISAMLNSTFHGRFDENFSADKPISNTRGYHSPQPFPVPEPTTLLVLVAGGMGLVYRQRRRLAK